MLKFDIILLAFEERATECQRKFLSFTAPTIFLLRSFREDDLGRCFDVNSILWKFVSLFNYNDYHKEISSGLFFVGCFSLFLWRCGFWIFFLSEAKGRENLEIEKFICCSACKTKANEVKTFITFFFILDWNCNNHRGKHKNFQLFSWFLEERFFLFMTFETVKSKFYSN